MRREPGGELMRHRLFLPVACAPGDEVTLANEQATRIARVLRLRSGDCIGLFDGAGGESAAVLQVVTPRRVTARIVSHRRRDWPFPWRPVLYLPLIRPQRFEWALEKAVELGAWEVIPVVTARTAHGALDAGPQRERRWRRILEEAAEQCCAAFVPRLLRPTLFAEALAQPAALRLLAWEDAGDTDRVAPSAALQRLSSADSELLIALFVGPEGGFAPEEAAAARAAGCVAVTLGPHILRAETAAVVLLGALLEASERVCADAPVRRGES
jgi:16S rRNA (uracil1498-N3)-methyltransferase